MATSRIALFTGIVALLCGSVADAEPSAERVAEVLQANCHRCHGQDGAVEGGFNYVMDLPQLVARGKIVPGDAAGSKLFRRLDEGTMPPPDEQPRPTEADIELIREWIDAGAPGLDAGPQREFVSNADVNQAILADLEQLPPRDRRFQRYFTLTHFHNAGYSDDQLQTYRNALSKLVNSLSWAPEIRVPAAVDEAGTILRIDLRWYFWDAVLWNRILEDYPYGILDGGAASKAVSVETLSRIPAIRADWFVATASRPPLYREVLLLPGSLPELERELRIDARVNISQDRVMRAGFNGSGISQNNRVLERHLSTHGYYWRSYDFEAVPENLAERGLLLPDQRNVFAYPLGPGNVRAENTFLHAGGEVIFQLPNGLQGYMLVNAVGNSIDKAPVEIVSDPKRPDRAVELGVSCMGCHVTGILPKEDQIRDHLAENPGAFPEDEAELIRALYPPKEETLAAMQQDSASFLRAVEETGTVITGNEPIMAMTLRYEGELDATLAAAELGMPVDQLRQAIAKSNLLKRNLGAFLVEGGTVQRPIWVQALGDVVNEMGLGALFAGNPSQGALPDNTGDLDPLENAAGDVNSADFSDDGQRVLTAKSDRSVRLREVESGRDLKRLIGHTASVWSAAISADGKYALTGSMDETVRWWNLDRGRELRQFNGHATVVTAVAISENNRWAISGGFDGRVIVWDVETGAEAARLEEGIKHVHAVGFVPKPGTALIAADERLIVWDWKNGRVVRTFEGHAGAVTCFALHGGNILTGGDDRVAILWDLQSGEPTRRFEGHLGYVTSVAFDADGKRVLTGGSDRTVRIWGLEDGRELGVFTRHATPVVNAAFTPAGTQTVSIDRGGEIRVWGVERFAASE